MPHPARRPSARSGDHRSGAFTTEDLDMLTATPPPVWDWRGRRTLVRNASVKGNGRISTSNTGESGQPGRSWATFCHPHRV